MLVLLAFDLGEDIGLAEHEEILAVGDGKVSEQTGERTPLDVSEGDEVLYSKYGGTEIQVDGEDLLVLRESDVLARVES